MKGYLNTEQIKYVLYHLNTCVDLKGISEAFVFIKDDKIELKSNSIIFQLSEASLKYENILRTDNIPILFPIGDKTNFYSIQNASFILLRKR